MALWDLVGAFSFRGVRGFHGPNFFSKMKMRLLGGIGLVGVLAMGWLRAADAPNAPVPAAAAGPIVKNGGFEVVDPADKEKPQFWERLDGLGVQWTNAPADDKGRAAGKAIRMNTAISEKDFVANCKKVGLEKWVFPDAAASAIAETYGLSYYSDAMPVVKGQKYKVTALYRGPGGGAKIWVRAYGMFQGEMRRRYEAQFTCTGNPNTWTENSMEFTPSKMRDVSEMKVMLFAYYPPGVYWFDNVKIEPVGEPVTGPVKK